GVLSIAPLETLWMARDDSDPTSPERTRLRKECIHRYLEFPFGDSTQSECLKRLISRRYDHNVTQEGPLDKITTKPKLSFKGVANDDPNGGMLAAHKENTTAWNWLK
ncbi:MAG: hypothetical protein MHM6MM_007622, partial [Cercozoa sp. M6MM]